MLSKHQKQSGVFLHSCKIIFKLGELYMACRTSRKCFAPSVGSRVFCTFLEKYFEAWRNIIGKK